jgi:Fe-S cluster assembly protein SufD
MAAALEGERTALAEQAAPARTSAVVGRRYSRDPDAFPAITGREEEWRFTPLNRLKHLHDGTAVVDGTLPVTVTAPAGATVETIGPDHELVGVALTPTDKPAALAMRGFRDGRLVRVEGELAEPVVLRFEGAGATSYGHVVVDVAPFGKAVVVLDHTGTAKHVGAVEVRVGDSADVTVVSLQDWDRDAVHLSAQAALVGRDARYKHVVVTLGGDLVRINPTVRYAGPGGDAELLGLAFADAGQHLEHRLLVDHQVPGCRSRVTYKTAAQGDEAHSVWVGDVFIGAEAVGTDTYELNRNLLLTDAARADSVPNLEIETGEIAGAGHASATGRFDDQHVFYLQSRGIPADEARRMIVRGFFAEVVQRIGLPDLEERLLCAIDEELDR